MRRLALVGAALTAVLALSSPAVAIPAGGASPDTAGTSASVSPATLAAGALIRFTVSGFPAGEVVYVKIDDGRFCAQQGVHGACVVHQQRIGGSGTVSGSFTLPADLQPGAHWLRFLASAELTGDDGSYLGVKGYTSRGNADFTVVGASSGTADAAPQPESGSAPGADQGAGDTLTAPSASVAAADPEAPALKAGAVLVVPAPSARPTAAAPESTTGPAAPDPVTASTTPTSAEVAAPAADDHVPVVGLLGAALLGTVALGLVLRARRTRG